MTKTPSSPSRLARRRGATGEATFIRLLAFGTAAFAGLYVVGLAFLVLRGGTKVISFTAFPTPLSDIEGEVALRVLVGLAFFGVAAGLALRMLTPLLARWPRAERAVLPTALACAACCIGPILGVLSAIAALGVVSTVYIGLVGLAVTMAAVAAIIVARKRRRSCTTGDVAVVVRRRSTSLPGAGR